MKRLIRLTIVGICSTLILGGCNIHLDLGLERLPDLSVNDVARNTAAICDTQVANAIKTLALTGKAAKRAQTHAEERLQAWGPVWIPWPKGKPKDGTEPQPTPAAPSTPETLLEHIALCAAQAESDASVVDDPRLGIMLASAALARSLEATQLASEIKQKLPVPKVKPATALVVQGRHYKEVPPENKPISKLTEIDSEQIKQLQKYLIQLDRARSDLEFAAAQKGGPNKTTVIALADYSVSVIDMAAANGVSITTSRLYPPPTDVSLKTTVSKANEAGLGALLHLQSYPQLHDIAQKSAQAYFSQMVALEHFPALPGIVIDKAKK